MEFLEFQAALLIRKKVRIMEGENVKDPINNVKFISQLYYAPTDHMKVLR
jgi:hypothetical protein